MPTKRFNTYHLVAACNELLIGLTDKGILPSTKPEVPC